MESNDERLEYCILCDDLTYKAGRDDDSLFDSNGHGPYCDDCFDELEDTDDDQISDWRHLLGKAMAERDKEFAETIGPHIKPILEKYLKLLVDRGILIERDKE